PPRGFVATVRRPPPAPSLLPPEGARRLLDQLVRRAASRPAPRPRVLRGEEDRIEEELLQLVEERAGHLADVARVAEPGGAEGSIPFQLHLPSLGDLDHDAQLSVAIGGVEGMQGIAHGGPPYRGADSRSRRYLAGVLSVLLPARNSAATLPVALEGLFAQ